MYHSKALGACESDVKSIEVENEREPAAAAVSGWFGELGLTLIIIMNYNIYHSKALGACESDVKSIEVEDEREPAAAAVSGWFGELVSGGRHRGEAGVAEAEQHHGSLLALRKEQKKS